MCIEIHYVDQKIMYIFMFLIKLRENNLYFNKICVFNINKSYYFVKRQIRIGLSCVKDL